ncbi:MAG: hypothetical protein ABIX10_14550 [Acidimicrobiales bacterium]
MNPLTTFVRSLGNDRALANAQAALDATSREDWLVQGLTGRLAHSATAPPVAAHATRRTG